MSRESHDFLLFSFILQELRLELTYALSRSSENFDELSQLGHFLKGSSATLGLTKVKDACEKIQHCKEEIPETVEEPEKNKSMDNLKQTLKEVQEDYDEVSKLLKRFYGEKIES